MSTALQGNGSHPLRLLMRVPVPWVFILTYLIGVGAEYVWPLRSALEALPGVSVAGGVLFGAGAVVAGWGLWTFHRARTTTVPGEASSQLVTWGLYRFSRNPMYVGLTLLYLGEAGILRQVLPAILLPLTIAYVNGVVIPVEEGKLKEVFGQEYERYQARVRRWV
ncbi:MAG TPA: isoprenylcysteine carboxylmethyltransferase family protein [Thermoanaerobaculia bacterium]|jgi:protein-S-isoprenylcysteine O-methyltransferase Ste14|nr:isoprenylcysteine carboxylmethyltransferase family protein [Thermoanaerobaculia bacterium]